MIAKIQLLSFVLNTTQAKQGPFKGLASFYKKIISKVIKKALLKKKVLVLSFAGVQGKEVSNLVDKIKKETDFLLDYLEAYYIYSLVRATKKVTGEISEVGVYKGGSAKFIAELKEGKALHLFDTFQGLPYNNPQKDAPGFKVGLYAAPADAVKKILGKYQEVYIYEGVFPLTAGAINEKKFSFVHLDVDLYKSTLDSLEFFYPRLSRGGCILSHDCYPGSGAAKAFEEFFADKPEIVVELPITQYMVIKL